MTPIDARELAGKVATAMGADWTITPNEHEDSYSHTTIHHIDDRQYGVWLSTTWGPRGMLHCAGNFEWRNGSDGLRYGEKRPSINVALTKPPEQIAKDILRRLLPIYQPMYVRASAEVAAAQAYETRKASLEAEWQAVERDYDRTHPYSSGKVYVHGRVESDMHLKLALSNLSLTQVKAILAQLDNGGATHV